MTVNDLALAYYRGRLQGVDPHLIFLVYLVRTGQVSDFPGCVDPRAIRRRPAPERRMP